MSPVARFARAAANGKSNASTVHDSEDCYVRDVSELVIWMGGERGHGGTGETRSVRRKREGYKVADKRQFKSRRKIKYIRS